MSTPAAGAERYAVNVLKSADTRDLGSVELSPTNARAEIDISADPAGTTIAQILGERADQIWRRFKHDNKISHGAIGIPRRPVLLWMAFEELLLEARAADRER